MGQFKQDPASAKVLCTYAWGAAMQLLRFVKVEITRSMKNMRNDMSTVEVGMLLSIAYNGESCVSPEDCRQYGKA